MKTDQLIRALAADNETHTAPVSRLLVIALLAAFLIAALLFALLIGPRPDIAAVSDDPRFLFKFVVTLALVATTVPLALRLAEPGRAANPALVALALSPLLLAAGVLVEFSLLAPGERMTRLIGRNWAYCLTYIPLLSAPLLAAALVALRHGAPTRPALAGGVAGLLAGGIGATLYAAHCIDDSPLFVATWYTLAIGAVAIVGALIGWRVLRW
jgi:hypothetical protein